MRNLCNAFKTGQLPNSMTHQRYDDVTTLKSKRAA